MKRPLPPEAFTLAETYRETRLPVELASTLIPDAYTEESFFALERERVFAQSWVPVCVADEVPGPGDYLVVEVAGRSLIVCRKSRCCGFEKNELLTMSSYCDASNPGMAKLSL